MDFVALLDQRQLLSFPFLQGSEERRAEAAYFTTELQRFLDQDQATHRACRLIEATHSRAYGDTGFRRFNQHTRIERWVKKGEWAHHARDVHAMSNLEEPVRHGVPVAQQLVVARDAEVEGTPDTKEGVCAILAPGSG